MVLFEKIVFDIPVLLRPFVMAVVQGETSVSVQTKMQAPPTGFPVLIYLWRLSKTTYQWQNHCLSHTAFKHCRPN